jgi:hypothetical protein
VGIIVHEIVFYLLYREPKLAAASPTNEMRAVRVCENGCARVAPGLREKYLFFVWSDLSASCPSCTMIGMYGFSEGYLERG